MSLGSGQSLAYLIDIAPNVDDPVDIKILSHDIASGGDHDQRTARVLAIDVKHFSRLRGVEMISLARMRNWLEQRVPDVLRLR